MGHHDPLDGFITYHQLQTTAKAVGEYAADGNLGTEISDLESICEGKNWTTDDPLGLGGLLCDTYRVAQLVRPGTLSTDLVATLLDASLQGLHYYHSGFQLKLPADYRLAFRELGLSIGLQVLAKLRNLIEENPDSFMNSRLLYDRIDTLKQYEPLVETIHTFWLDPANQRADSWTSHVDINMVMLATSLAPDGYLTLH